MLPLFTYAFKQASRNDCFAISVPNGYCCFKPSNGCKFVKKGEINKNSEYDCGITEENYGKYEFDQYHPKQDLENLGFETCGKTSPKKKTDCTDYSELSNSCCLFTKDGTKSCLLIGRKYIGDYKKTTFPFNGGQIEVECKSFTILFNLYSILLILLFL